MNRHQSMPRYNWQEKVAEQGLIYHTPDGHPYWDESVCYCLTAAEVDSLEAATNQLVDMCLAAGQHILDQCLFRKMGIPEAAIPAIQSTWEAEPPAIYGRFDLAFDGKNIKLLEFNADTPTALLEAAVVQWYWLEDTNKQKDQFNSIHEKLVAKWKELREYLASPLYFAHLADNEDAMTVSYLRQTAEDAGHKTVPILMEDVGWDAAKHRFVDLDGNTMASAFKLYPWEWMFREQFGQYILNAECTWLEPAWKMLWSNKGLLAVLWELYPNHPLLLEAHWETEEWSPPNYVQKPLLGREGHNITLVQNGAVALQTTGEYGAEGYVRQAIAPVPAFDGNFPVFGSWVVDLVSAGVGIREGKGLITGNLSRFVPHYFE